MKDRELNMLENMRKVLDISYSKEPFKNIEALSLVFSLGKTNEEDLCQSN